MRVWRTLKSLGTAVLRDGVYLLPDRAESRAAFESQCEEVVASGGSAHVLVTPARDVKQADEFVALFDRSADYEALLQEIRDARATLKQTDLKSLGSEVTRLRREFEAIAEIDFFPGRAHEQTQHALNDLIGAANAILSPGEPHPAVDRGIQKLRLEDYRGRIWATRRRPWADRLASAWLIRRFIDPQARILWLDKPSDCPADALGFDFDDATFTHVGDKVTMEVLIASFGLEGDKALAKLGALINYLDVGGTPVADAAGFERLLRGAREAIADDDALLSETSRLFDLLYAGYQRTG
jgi:hypothetical protein